MNKYTVEQKIPGVALWQVVVNGTIVVATCDTERKAKLLVEVLEENNRYTHPICWDLQ